MKTPETDNLARGNHVVPTEWAEQLERERDEARKLAEAFHQDQVSLLRERDDARKESEYYKERYEQLKEIPKWYNGREIPADIKEEAK